MRRVLAMLATLTLLLLAGCGSSNPTTIYDLNTNIASYNGQEITVLGTYLWKPGDPGLSVLVPGVSTTDAGTDAQPIGDGIWLDSFPADVSGQLHLPGDAVYGIVEVTGKVETGSFGPEGAYKARMVVTRAEAAERIERLRREAPGDVPNGTALAALLAEPARFGGQQVTTRGLYFWSPTTGGLLASAVEAEQADGLGDAATAAAGLNPRPVDPKLALDGFPPEMSEQLHVGPGNSFVWGLVEVTGRFETGGNWGPDGSIQNHLQIEQVTPLEER